MAFMIVFGITAFLWMVLDFFYISGFSRRSRTVLDEETAQILDKLELHLPEEELKMIHSFDGTKLAGYFYHNSNANTMAIVIHGYGMTHEEMRGIADIYFNEFGYSVLLPDLRGHGASGGKYIGFGWHDRLDILQWIGYIRNMMGDEVPIVLHGISMGGATALMTGEENPENVKCVISDCSYTSISDILAYRMKKEFRLSAFPLLHMVNIAVRIRGKYSIYDGDILAKLENCKIPVLYIHGGKDEYIPTNWVYSLYEKTKSKKELYICDGADHAKSVLVDPVTYFKRVKGFLTAINL